MNHKKVLLAVLLLLLCAALAGCSDGAKSKTVDVDISAMPSATAYSFAYDMFNTEPENYRGYTVRVAGQYDQSYFEETGLYYDYVVVSDGTCCMTGVEFKPEQKASLPAVGESIELVGVVDSYEELGQTYFYLKNASVTVLPRS